MVLRLADVLDVPLRDRNRLLQVAGFAPAYPEAAPSAAELAPFRMAIDRLLAAHEPFPGLVLDHRSRIVAANRAASLLFGPGLVGTNMIERYLTDPALREAVVNWPDVAWAALARLRKQLYRAPFDEELRVLVSRAEAAAADLPASRLSAGRADQRSDQVAGQHSLVACPWFRVGDTVIRTIAMAARFDTALEVSLDELRVELIYPQDAVAEEFFRTAADGQP